MNREPSLVIEGISKSFPPADVRACSNVSLPIFPGTILAVVGENGAGKSTLMNILCGTVIPDSGSFKTAEGPVPSGNPEKSARSGIGMVHQHPTLSPTLTVLENIILGFEPRRFGFLTDRRKAAEEIEEICSEYGLNLNPDQLCSELNSVQVQSMELLHLLYKERKILIFDEPTASLSEHQTEQFLSLLNRLKAEGRTIIFISHKLTEVFRMADELAVMRHGEIVYHDNIENLNPAEVAALMIGREEDLQFPARDAISERESETSLYEIRNVSYRQSESRFLKNISLDIKKGEILGITGIRENGLELLEDLISGMIHPAEGKLLFNGSEVTRSGPAELRKKGISYVPADRLNRGVSRDSSIAENLILLNYKRMHKMGILAPSSINRWARDLQSSYSIDGEPHQPIRHLSGGNIQKVILSRELEEKPDLIIICEPSWGLDFNSRNKLHRELDRTASGGTAVLLISSDIDEVISLSERIAVLYNGEIAAFDRKESLDRVSIGNHMLGLEVNR